MAGYGRDPVWTDRDRLLIIAWELYSASLCEGCGQEKHRAMNPDMSGFYEVQTYQCFACDALESYRRARSHDSSFKEFVLDTRAAGDEPAPWELLLIPTED